MRLAGHLAGYFQLSRFKFVDGANPHLDLTSEQKILQVPNNRGACCHVAGDIDFDTHNNLWLVTGDDTPSGGGNSGGFSPHNDQMTAGRPVQRAVRRRASQRAQHQRPARQGPAHHGQGRRLLHVPAGNLFAPGTDKTRPEIYAMGFRNPFRIQVDENDVAYVTDYSPDSATPENFRGPAGTGRVEIIRKPSNYGWPLCVLAEAAVLPLELQHEQAAGRDADAARLRQPDARAAERVALEHRAVDPYRAGDVAASPDLWYSFRDNANPPLGTPCLASYDGSGGTLPAALPRALHDRRRPARRGPVPLRRGQPEQDEVPAVLRRRVRPRRVRPDTLREVRVDDDNEIFKINRCSTAATRSRRPRRSRSSATTRWTCSSAPTARSTC